MHLAEHFSQHGGAAPARRPGILARCQAFLFWCAGADADYLADCPRIERVKSESIGAIICCTAIGAFASMFMAVSIAFAEAPYLPFLIAPVWAVFIFVLDRFVVSTMLPHSGLVPRIVQTSLRMVLALLIALVIARPLEIKIFKTEIDKLLRPVYQEIVEQRAGYASEPHDLEVARIEQARDRRLALVQDQIDGRRARLAGLLADLDDARARAADLEDQKLAEADCSAGSR